MVVHTRVSVAPLHVQQATEHARLDRLRYGRIESHAWSEGVTPYHFRTQPHVSSPPIHHALWQRLSSPALADRQRLHVLLEIQIQILKHQIQLMPISMHNVQQAHDIRVVHLLEQGNLADGGGGNALVFGFQADLLESYDAIVGRGEVAGFVDYSVGAFTITRWSAVNAMSEASGEVDWFCLPSPIFSIFW